VGRLVGLAALGLAWSAYRWRLRRQAAELWRKVGEAVASVKILRGLLPICELQADPQRRGYWEQIEAYIRDRR
jgi:hypothetical protein